MPANKDFKRIVRTRMSKTGESYTAARTQILRKTPKTEQHQPSPAEYAHVAGISDDAVKAKTGCNWERWVWTLDRLGAARLPHREIALTVSEKYRLNGWWAQTVTVGYERIRGLREKGQRRGGKYRASRSKTIAVPLAKLYRAFSYTRTRNRWIPGAEFEIRKATRDKAARLTWGDGTLVQLYFYERGPSKSQITIQHTELASRDEATRVRTYWGNRLATLADLLHPST